MTTDIDDKCVNTIRCLSIDMVQAANSGHPGMPLGMAPVAHVLFSRILNFSSKNPKWLNRDRFVLSNGHGCALLYSLLHLCGYDLSLEDLKNFRQIGSKTPGHPENIITPGVEVTTGPLGQGLANAVGISIASKHVASTFSKSGFEQLFDNYVYVFAGDGCLMEGITSEASSMAGHLGLGNLIVIYDDNQISIDGNTSITFTEDVAKRYEAYGWHVQQVQNGDSDLQAIEKSIENAKQVKDKPSIICLKTTIGFGSKLQGSSKAHGAPLGPEGVSLVKQKFGFPPDQAFLVPEEVSKFYQKVYDKGAQKELQWNESIKQYSEKYPELGKQLNQLMSGNPVPSAEQLDGFLPKYNSTQNAEATRKLSGKVLNVLADQIPFFLGGSADLAASNNTDLAKSHSFQKGAYDGRIIRFGVREHAMGAICNGIASYGFIPFCATFLNFVGYMFGAIRLSALSEFRVIYVMTHDSIALGEDGPTHQPIEVLSLLRSTPNILVFRPADGNEVSGSYREAVLSTKAPSVIALTRQDLPQLDHSSSEKVKLGGYVVYNQGGDGNNNLDLVLVASGSEVSLCIDAAKELEKKQIKTRVVSMPCLELFAKQSKEYRESILLDGSVPVISVELGATFGWDRYSHVQIGLDRFGASGPCKKLFEKFGFTVPSLCQKAENVLSYYKTHPQLLHNLSQRFE